MASFLMVEEGQGIARITLNRPEKRNALCRALRREIVQALERFAQDDRVAVVLLTGAGPAFCAGFDREELAREGAEAFADSLEYHRKVYTFPKPILAAVNGAALGGGCDLAAMCDIRIASTEAAFGQPQVRFGAPALYELMRFVMGPAAAREMCLTGRLFSASEALARGLVNCVVEPPILQEASLEIAREIAALPPGVGQSLKRDFLASQPPLFEP